MILVMMWSVPMGRRCREFISLRMRNAGMSKPPWRVFHVFSRYVVHAEVHNVNGPSASAAY